MSADEGAGISMAATNGERSTATPDPSTLATPGKRKRVSSHDDKETSAAISQVEERIKLQENLRNLFEILSKNDTELQLLSCPLPSSPVKPRSKRAKIAGDRDEASTIQARVASDRYSTLSEFLSDIEKASTAVIERNKVQTSSTPTDGTPVTETVNRIAAFKKLLNSLVRQAHVSQIDVKAETPGNDTEASAKPPTSTVEVRNNGLVLTLFGNPANPKQLYSSLQKSVKVPLSSDKSETKKYVEVQTPLPEVGLPNGITTSKVAPYDNETKPQIAKRTFKEVFAPKAALPQLEPPRRARSSSRTSQVNWIDPFDAVTNYKAFLGDRNNYSFAQLPSGNWLQYGGVTSSPSFWGRRQKQQSPQQHTEENSHDDPILWTDDDSSLLQGVYSSFAPSFDSSGAVVQADSKNLVWWSKRGAKRLNALLSILDEDDSGGTAVQPGSIGDLDESILEAMVKSFKPDEFTDPSIQSDATKEDLEEQVDKTSRDTDELLAEVSDLLETLSSYQRIRNLELPTPTNQSAEGKDTSVAQGAQDKPSDAERDVYETLRSSLSVLIAQLPPFAVAKLNGDQLAELNISQKILVENTDYAGSMEKDDHTIQQERAAAAAAAATTVPNRTSTPSRSSSYQAQYNQRAFANNARIQPQGAFQGQQPYYPARQPSTPGAYTPGNPQHFPGGRPPATPGQRPGYFPGYAQPNPQFSQGNSVPQQYQRPGQNGYNPYTSQSGPAPVQASPQQFTQRPGQPAPYNTTPYVAGRSASPQRPPTYVAPRAPFVPPGSNPQQRFVQHPQQHQQSPQYGNFTPNQTPNTYSNSAAAVTYARSAAEQAALMDRNRVQLAAQGSPVPQQPPVDDRSSQDGSATPGNKQNGTPAPG